MIDLSFFMVTQKAVWVFFSFHVWKLVAFERLLIRHHLANFWIFLVKEEVIFCHWTKWVGGIKFIWRLIILHFSFKLRKPFQVDSLLWVESKAHDRFLTICFWVKLIFSNILSELTSWFFLVCIDFWCLRLRMFSKFTNTELTFDIDLLTCFNFRTQLQLR